MRKRAIQFKRRNKLTSNDDDRAVDQKACGAGLFLRRTSKWQPESMKESFRSPKSMVNNRAKYLAKSSDKS